MIASTSIGEYLLIIMIIMVIMIMIIIQCMYSEKMNVLFIKKSV